MLKIAIVIVTFSHNIVDKVKILSQNKIKKFIMLDAFSETFAVWIAVIWAFYFKRSWQLMHVNDYSKRESATI